MVELTDLEKRLIACGKVIYGKQGSLPTIEKGGYEWQRWREWRKANNLPWKGWGTAAKRVTVVSELPPTDIGALEAQVFGSSNSGRYRNRNGYDD